MWVFVCVCWVWPLRFGDRYLAWYRIPRDLALVRQEEQLYEMYETIKLR